MCIYNFFLSLRNKQKSNKVTFLFNFTIYITVGNPKISAMENLEGSPDTI